jgi:hypothetical protein
MIKKPNDAAPPEAPREVLRIQIPLGLKSRLVRAAHPHKLNAVLLAVLENFLKTKEAEYERLKANTNADSATQKDDRRRAPSLAEKNGDHG